MDEGPPEPPLLEAEQARLPQPFHLTEMPQSLKHFRCPALCPLQELHVCPVLTEHSRCGHHPLPRPAANAVPAASQHSSAAREAETPRGGGSGGRERRAGRDGSRGAPPPPFPPPPAASRRSCLLLGGEEAAMHPVFQSSRRDFTFGPWKLSAARTHIMKSAQAERWGGLRAGAPGGTARHRGHSTGGTALHSTAQQSTVSVPAAR